MTKFDRYMLSQLLMVFGFSSVVLVLIYWINRAVRLFDWLIASGQSASVFLEFTALTLPNVIRIVLPISAFAATVYTTNRLSSESELVVVQATGYGPGRLARPVMVFGAFVGLFVGLLVHFAVPASFARLADRQVEVAENVTARLLVEGRFVHPDAGVTLYIRAITGSGELEDIYLRDARREDSHVTYTASRALLARTPQGPRLVMYDGMAQTYTIDTRRLALTRFEEFAVDVAGLIDAGAGGRDTRNIRELGTGELLAARPETATALGATPRQLRIEGHGRFSQPLMAAMVPLLGFATLLLGGFSRFGIWNQIFAAVGLLIVIYTLDNAMQDRALDMEAGWILLYAAPLLGFGTVMVMLWAAANPGLFRRRPGPPLPGSGPEQTP